MKHRNNNKGFKRIYLGSIAEGKATDVSLFPLNALEQHESTYENKPFNQPMME